MPPQSPTTIKTDAVDAGAASGSKGQRTRKRLLDATASEVARHGIAGTSINSIAAAAGLKTGSVYFHFESKDALVEAMLKEGLRASLGYLDRALAAVAEPSSPAARLKAAIRAHAAAVRDHADYTMAVLGRAAPTEFTGADSRSLRRHYVQRWSQLVAEAQAAGALPCAPDPRLLRDMMIGAINTAALAGRKPDQIADALMALAHIG